MGVIADELNVTPDEVRGALGVCCHVMLSSGEEAPCMNGRLIEEANT